MDLYMDAEFIGNIINRLIFTITLVVVVSFFRDEGKWTVKKVKEYFKYYTVLSNVLCAIAAYCMVVKPKADWAWLLKYIATVGITVTMLTVFLYLAPTMKNLWVLLKGRDLFMHLITPVLAIVSFLVFERREMDYTTIPFGVLPVVVYGVVYLYMIRFVPKEYRWDDFYGFNRKGLWPLSFALMLIATYLICIGFYMIMKHV